MTAVYGDIGIVTETPALVTEVRVHAPDPRPWRDGVMTTLDDKADYSRATGKVSFESAPGAAVLSLYVSGRRQAAVELIVPDEPEATLRACIEAARLADGRTATELQVLIDQLQAQYGITAAAADRAVGARNRSEAAAEDAEASAGAAAGSASAAELAAGEAATEAAGLAADAVRLEVKEDADRSAAGAITATEKAAEAAGSATRAEAAEAEAVEAEAGAEAGQELSEDAAAVAVAAAIGAAEASSNKADTVYVDAQDQALSERIDEEKWSRGRAHSNDADLIRGDGMEGVWNFGTAGVNLPERLTGYVAFVEASYHQATNSTHQRAWSTNPYRRGEQYERSYWSGSWSEWEEIGAGSDAPHSPPTEWVQDLLYTTHLDTVTEDGIWRQHNTGSASPENGYPEDAGRGILQVVGITASEIHQTYSTQSGVWVRRIPSGEPTMWAKVNPTVEQYQITQNFQAGEEKIGINWSERDTRIDQMRQAVGRVHTGGKAAICLSFDHGTKNFKEFVLPALRERGLKSSLALNSQRLDPSYGHYASEGATWAEVKAWADSGVEITNHSRTHQGAIGETDTYREIVLGREELEAHIGRPVWTWRGHGYLGGDDHNYDGYGDISGTPEAFYNTYAGKLLLSAHPMVTGGIKPPYDCFPLDGEIPIGPRGAWIDTPSQLETAKRNIQYAVDNKMRIYINCHPQFVEFNDEYITRQDLFDFFDYVKGFIDAGQLVDLTFAEWSVADSGETVVTGGVDKAYVDQSLASLHHYSGTGFPEGKVTAPVGATYTDTAATNGAVRWIKTTGTGATGWRVEYGDTGWRDITDELTGTVLELGTGAKILIRRKLYDLEVLFVGPITLAGSWGQTWATSQGFRPERESETALGENARLRLGRYNARIENGTRDSELIASGRSLFTSLPSEIDWPATLPGTPE